MAGTHILLVENDPDDEALILHALGRDQRQREVVVAHDGVEALDYLLGTGPDAGRTTDMVPDLVVLDLKLPKLTGLEVLQRLRADDRTRVLPVVIFSSSTEPQDVIDCYRLGANSYVHKPVEFVALAAAIQQVARYWLDVNTSVLGYRRT